MSVSRRKQGQRLNKQGRLSPLEVIQKRLEYFNKLADDELAKGEDASREKVSEFLAEAQNAAVEILPYRFPRLQATSNEVVVRHAVIRSPELCDTNEEWIQKYVPKQVANGNRRRSRSQYHSCITVADDATMLDCSGAL